nr:MAG TPA: hypothetical protein [Caudoviricetes sp.]
MRVVFYVVFWFFLTSPGLVCYSVDVSGVAAPNSLRGSL